MGVVLKPRINSVTSNSFDLVGFLLLTFYYYFKFKLELKRVSQKNYPTVVSD